MSVNEGVPPPHTLAAGRLGGAFVVFLALAAATPLTIVATVVPDALPPIFLVLGLVLLTFAAGYTAMARRMPHAGPLYAFVARGLGRQLGVGAAWLALLSYGALQLGLYGIVGAAVAALGFSVPWWAAALACWAVVALCGIMRIQVTAWLLAVLVLAEVVVIAGYSAANALDPDGGRLSRAALGLSLPDRTTLGVLLVTGVLTFIGFEIAAAYTEETRRRTAVYPAIIVLTVLYAGAGWAMSVAAGPGARSPELMFDLAAARLAPWAVTLGRALVVTGLLAAMIALHQTTSRYLFALGRERVLPQGLGRTARRTSAPRAASLTQSVLTGAAIGAGAYAVSDPAGLAERLTVGGGLGILVLLLATALSALLFLNRQPNGEGAWARLLAPGLATVALGTLTYLAGNDVPVPEIVAASAAVLLGVLHGLALRLGSPVVYAGIGLGGAAVVVAPTSAPVVIPAQRRPGAHRPERVRNAPDGAGDRPEDRPPARRVS